MNKTITAKIYWDNDDSCPQSGRAYVVSTETQFNVTFYSSYPAFSDEYSGSFVLKKVITPQSVRGTSSHNLTNQPSGYSYSLDGHFENDRYDNFFGKWIEEKNGGGDTVEYDFELTLIH